MKFIYMGYVVVIVIVVALVVALMRIQLPPSSGALATLDSLVARAPSAVARETPSAQPPDQDDDPR